MGQAFDWYSALVPAIIYAISYYNEPRYNGNRLYRSQLYDSTHIKSEVSISYGLHCNFCSECYIIVITDNIESLYLISHKELFWDWQSGESDIDWNRQSRMVCSKCLVTVVLIILLTRINHNPSVDE